MRSHYEGLPHETLPPSWTPAAVTAARIVYRCRRPPVELVAVRTVADHTDPSLGVGRCWEIRCQYAVGEAEAVDRLERVSTRREALEGLLECMRCIHEELDGMTDPLAVRRVLAPEKP